MFFAAIVLSSFLAISATHLLYDGDKCFSNGTAGTCRKLSECESAKELLKKGLQPQNCGFVGFVPIVCCTQNTDSITDFVTNRERITAKDRCELFTEIKNRQEQVFYAVVVGGEDAKPGEYPHMAALGYGPPDNKTWFCGGSLISNAYVLTAAHCVNTIHGTVNYVRLGDYKLDGSSGTHIDYEIVNHVVHPEYNPPSTYHDIALLNLDRYVQFGIDIMPACLPTKPYESQIMEATGWGLTNFGGAPSNILQKVVLELFSAQKCSETYKNDKRRLSAGIRNDLQICAGSTNEEKDTCQGDSGGPLQYKDDALHVVVGITSFGKACGTPGVPGIYTNVAYYVEWIENTIWNPKRTN